jgi:hypothetical protein
MAIFSSGLLLVSWYCFVRVQHKFDQPLIPVGLLLLLSSHLAGVRLFFRRDSCWSLAVSLFESSRRPINFSSGLLLVFCFTPRISGVFDRILIGTSVDLLSSTSRVSLMLDQFLIATPFGLLFIHHSLLASESCRCLISFALLRRNALLERSGLARDLWPLCQKFRPLFGHFQTTPQFLFF